ncbi:Integrase [Thiohalospira halophila DSM 15071]|uniref:Integrase n=1 Tax=Thiohalospira halophila DSM 15071 TaxID=1123397 RepID=A0A1I1VZM4_9GAMM|nr:integrase arm-type DNA-binding domain-containing protein [Thiohalospira halophila]SFD86523.1 Integrase [Thiohalospira halophila DSM 15071]
MPKVAKELSAVEVKRLSKPGFHAVGGVSGLVLRVKETGSRQWVLRTTLSGKRHNIGLGGFPDVTLAQARERAREYKEQIWRGEDPLAARRAAEDARRAEEAKRVTFEEAARRCHEAKAAEFRNEKHQRDWIISLERYAFPELGSISVAEIELPHVLKALEPIWSTKTETATRVRQRIETVLTWATVSGYREGENPARWAGNLEVALPAPRKIRKVQHHRALPWKEVPGFMAALRQREGMGARALEFAILTAARSGEVRGARWSEIDLPGRVWTVPADRIKAGKEHRVPLSDDAVALLESLPRFEGSDLVFTTSRGGGLSDATISAVCKRMGVDATPHGFRSSLKDWARSCTTFADEVSELALAHVNSDATRSAYARDELLPQRARLMADWAHFCRHGEPEAATVTSIGEGRA